MLSIPSDAMSWFWTAMCPEHGPLFHFFASLITVCLGKLSLTVASKSYKEEDQAVLLSVYGFGFLKNFTPYHTNPGRDRSQIF